MLQEEVDLHVALRISRSPLTEEPWPHIVIQDVLPVWVYNVLQGAAPAVPLGAAVAGRRFRLVGPDFSPAVAAFESKQVLDALEKKLGFRGFPWPRLVHDLEGYEYKIHPDIYTKAGTLQLYLTPEHVPGYGTRLHRRLASLPKDEVSEVPSSHNVAYAIKRTEVSIHSTGRVGSRPRYSLLVPYMTEPVPGR